MNEVSHTATLQLRLPAELKHQVEDAATATNQSANTWLIMAVQAVLEDDRTGPSFYAGRVRGQVDTLKTVIEQLDRTRAALKRWQHMAAARRDLDEAQRVALTELAESISADRRGGGGTPGMSSMYDSFWKPRLSVITTGLGAVADGAGAQIIDVSGLTEYGRRPSGWSGSVRLWNTGNSSTSGTAAHVKALVRLLIGTGILGNWPDLMFRLSVNIKGDTLTLKRA